jgi:hypothetical protein
MLRRWRGAGGAVAEGPVVASRRQGVAGELEGPLGGRRVRRGLAGLTEVVARRRAERWLGATTSAGVLTGGRVGDNSG